MHHDHDVEFLRLGPKRIELGRAVIVAVDVGADVAAAEIQIAHGALQHLGGARGILQWHRCHADEPIGITFDQLGDSIVVNVAPVFTLLAGEPISQRCGVRFQRGHGEFGVRHHLQPLVDRRQLGMKHEGRTAGKGERLMAVFFDQARRRDACRFSWLPPKDSWARNDDARRSRRLSS